MSTASLAMYCIWRLGKTDLYRGIQGRTALTELASHLTGDVSICHSPKDNTSQQRVLTHCHTAELKPCSHTAAPSHAAQTARLMASLLTDDKSPWVSLGRRTHH